MQQSQGARVVQILLSLGLLDQDADMQDTGVSLYAPALLPQQISRAALTRLIEYQQQLAQAGQVGCHRCMLYRSG